MPKSFSAAESSETLLQFDLSKVRLDRFLDYIVHRLISIQSRHVSETKLRPRWPVLDKWQVFQRFRVGVRQFPVRNTSDEIFQCRVQ